MLGFGTEGRGGAGVPRLEGVWTVAVDGVGRAERVASSATPPSAGRASVEAPGTSCSAASGAVALVIGGGEGESHGVWADAGAELSGAAGEGPWLTWDGSDMGV